MNNNIDQDYEPVEIEEVDEKCPECGSNRMTRWPRATSPDDYTFAYECKECGTTWET